MSNPAFFVDGHLEQKFIQKYCPGAPVKLINCNGKNVVIDQIGKRVASLIKTMNNRNHPLIVIIDREDRENSASQIEKELKKSIQNHGINYEILIGVADRMIENWILADEDVMSEHIGYDRNAVYEGSNGKSEIRTFIQSYHETTTGVQLLCRSNPKWIAKKSKSFSKFFKLIKDLDCKWINQSIQT